MRFEAIVTSKEVISHRIRMEQCGNLSNSSATNFQAIPSPDLTALVIVLSTASIPVAIYNGLIAILLLQSISVAIQVRVPLINLLVETLITNVVQFCIVVIQWHLL